MSLEKEKENFDDLNGAMMENKLPMPDGVESDYDLVMYVKAVYGIHGEKAALFDEVVMGIVHGKERLRSELHVLKSDLANETEVDMDLCHGIQYGTKPDSENIEKLKEDIRGELELLHANAIDPEIRKVLSDMKKVFNRLFEMI